MKQVSMTLLFTALSLTSFCQCKYLINKKDEFTGAMEKQLELTVVGRGVYASVGRTDSTYYVTFAGNVGCTSQGQSKLYIKFIDETILTLTHQHKTSCGEHAIFVADVTHDIDVLLTKSVLKARLSGTEHNVDFDFTDPDYFKKSLACVK